MLKEKFYGKGSSKEFDMPAGEAMSAEDLLYIKKMHNEILQMNTENGEEDDHARLLAMSQEASDISSLLKNLEPE